MKICYDQGCNGTGVVMYCLQVSYFRAQQKLAFLHISNALLVTAVHVKMKLGDNALNN